MSYARAIRGAVVAVSLIGIGGCSSGGYSSATTTTSTTPVTSSTAVQTTSAGSDSTSAPAGITVTGDLEGALVLGAAFATCAGPDCSGPMMIGSEAGTLSVSPTATRVVLGEDTFQGPGTSGGAVSIPRAGTLVFSQLKLKGSGVAAGEAVVIDGTGSASS